MVLIRYMKIKPLQFNSQEKQVIQALMDFHSANYLLNSKIYAENHPPKEGWHLLNDIYKKVNMARANIGKVINGVETKKVKGLIQKGIVIRIKVLPPEDTRGRPLEKGKFVYRLSQTKKAFLQILFTWGDNRLIKHHKNALPLKFYNTDYFKRMNYIWDDFFNFMIKDVLEANEKEKEYLLTFCRNPEMFAKIFALYIVDKKILKEWLQNLLKILYEQRLFSKIQIIGIILASTHINNYFELLRRYSSGQINDKTTVKVTDPHTQEEKELSELQIQKENIELHIGIPWIEMLNSELTRACDEMVKKVKAKEVK